MKPIEATLPLPVRVAVRLRDDIEKGLWSDHLPGCRSLANHYGVSRKTCMASMLLLEEEEVIAPAEVGKKRNILIRPSPQPRKNDPHQGTLLVLHCSEQEFSARHLSNVNVLQTTWSDGGGHVAFQVVNYDRYSKPKNQLKQLIKRYQAVAIVLIAPRSEWLEEAARLLPTYSMGGLWPGDMKNATAHGFDFCHQIDQLISYLYRHGHRRIMIPNYHTEPIANYFHEAVTAGYHRFIGSNDDRRDVILDIPNFVSSEPTDWFRFWRDSLKRFEPTAVIPVQAVHLLSLYGFCTASKISIPRDLSVLCTEHHIQSEWMWPKPHMQKHSEAAVRKCFKQWIDGGLRPMGMKLLSLEIMEGNSVRDLNSL
ncbi:MAG: substrate-binding domain-containing protein [Akkermansiaceae bacterium]|nr:substrate-binding domain-containing protein [Akkermansiaceae bacterium]